MNSNPYLNAQFDTEKGGITGEIGRDYIDTNPCNRTPDIKQDGPIRNEFKLTETENQGTELKPSDKLIFDSTILNDVKQTYESITPYVKIPQTKEQLMENSVQTDKSAPQHNSTFGQIEEIENKNSQHVTFMV